MKDTWEEFRYCYIETGWFDYDRTKTVNAMKRLWELMPEKDLDKIPPVIVFAPSAAILGHVLSGGPGEAFIYLAPSLERKSQAEVDFTVAQEFAHVILGAYRPDYTRNIGQNWTRHKDAPSEKDADKLVVSWGFKRRKS